MPTTIRKVNGYSVRTPSGTKSKSTTLKKAKAQKRIIDAAKCGKK